MISVAPASSPSAEEQIEERGLAIAVERRGRLIGHDQLRRADQGAGGGNALLLADAEIGGRVARARGLRLEAQPRQQAHGLVLCRSLGATRRRRPGAKLNGSSTLSMTVP